MIRKNTKIVGGYLNKFKLNYLSSLRDVLKTDPQDAYYVHELSGLVIFFWPHVG